MSKRHRAFQLNKVIHSLSNDGVRLCENRYAKRCLQGIAALAFTSATAPAGAGFVVTALPFDVCGVALTAADAEGTEVGGKPCGFCNVMISCL
jgi:hypothetical protein